jgi:hypothetical protein
MKIQETKTLGDYVRAFNEACAANPDDGAQILLAAGLRIAAHQKKPSLSGAIQKFMAMARFLEPDRKFRPIEAGDLPESQRTAFERALEIAQSVKFIPTPETAPKFH